jgi:hypothetical protein
MQLNRFNKTVTGKDLYMSSQVVMQANSEKYREAALKGINWLVSIQNPDGSMNPVDKGALSYYKVPRAMAIGGKLSEANRLLDWARQTIFTKEGDFTGVRKGFHHYHYTYSSAWYVWISNILGRFEIANLGMQYLLKFRNPITGGYCAESTYSPNNIGEKAEQDLLAIAFNSYVGLHMGHVEEAKQAAKLIKRMLETQPEPDDKFWMRVDGSGNLVTKVSEKCDDPRFYLVDAHKPKEFYYFIGAAMIFLSKLAAYTGNKDYISVADGLYSFCEKCNEDLLVSGPGCKVGLGLAFLYKLTRKEKYLEGAIRNAEFAANWQDEDGSWADKSASGTAELSTWLYEIAAVLESKYIMHLD